VSHVAGIGPASLKTVGEYLYSELEFTPTTAKLAGGWAGKEPKPSSPRSSRDRRPPDTARPTTTREPVEGA